MAGKSGRLKGLPQSTSGRVFFLVGEYHLDTRLKCMVKLLEPRMRSKHVESHDNRPVYTDVRCWRCEIVLTGKIVLVDDEDLSDETYNEVEVLAWVSK